MKIKYKTTIYSKKYPYGLEKIVVSEGEPTEEPSYLVGCDNCIFLKNSKSQIFIIEKENIIKIFKGGTKK